MLASQKWQQHRQSTQQQSPTERWDSEGSVVSRGASADVFGINYIPSNLSVTPSSSRNDDAKVAMQRMMVSEAHSGDDLIQNERPLATTDVKIGKTDLSSSKCELEAALSLPPAASSSSIEDIKEPSLNSTTVARRAAAAAVVATTTSATSIGSSNSYTGCCSINGPFVKGIIKRCFWLLSRANKEQRVPILVLLILSFVQISGGSQLTALPAPPSSCCPILSDRLQEHQQQRQQQTIISRQSSNDESGVDCGGCDLSIREEAGEATNKYNDRHRASTGATSNNKIKASNNNMHNSNFYHDDDNQSANQSKSLTTQRLTPSARVLQSQLDNVTDNNNNNNKASDVVVAGKEDEGDGDVVEEEKVAKEKAGPPVGCRSGEALLDDGAISASTTNNNCRSNAESTRSGAKAPILPVRRDSSSANSVLGAQSERQSRGGENLDSLSMVRRGRNKDSASLLSFTDSSHEVEKKGPKEEMLRQRQRRQAPVSTFDLANEADRDPIGVISVSQASDMAPLSSEALLSQRRSTATTTKLADAFSGFKSAVGVDGVDSDHDREDDINNANADNQEASASATATVAAAAEIEEADVGSSVSIAQVASREQPRQRRQRLRQEAKRRLNGAVEQLIVSPSEQLRHSLIEAASDEIDADNLDDVDDDDLFLMPGSRVSMSAQEEEYYRRRRSSASSVRGKVETIYFGGFFPWLTDEDHHLVDSLNDDSVHSSKAKQHQQQQHKAKRKLRAQRKQEQQYENSNTTTSSATGQQSEVGHQLGRFILPAVRLALDHINNNSSILSSYRLEIVPRDTQCNATISLKEFFDMVYEAPKKMLLYGDACRVSTDPIAKASYFFDLIQISYADTDPIYTIENYPNFFRVVPSENALSLARIPFIRHFNWTRVGTIYQNLPRYSLPHSKLLTDLERYKIVIKQSVSLPGSVDGLQNRDLGDELRKLKEKDVRIILGNFDEEWALLLFCEAFREKMTGRKYQWILTGVSEDKLWRYYKSKGSECSEQELLIAMDGYIITDITPVTRSQRRTISGMMAHEYSNEYKRRAHDMNISIDENKFYGYVYDGIWAIALALHKVDYQLKYYNRLVEAGKAKLDPELEGLASLLDFDYHRPIWVKLIRGALNRTRFNGVTGTVSFHKNERPGLISFSQFQAFRGMSEVIIGSYDALNDHLDLKVGFPISWRGPSPPIDYTIQRVTPFRINRTLFVIISILALFGIVLAFIFLTINIKFRNQRYIKMSSPYLNNLIIIGCILTYTSVIILGLDSGLTSEYNFPYICNARAWVLMAGFTLAFGSMFSKTFRVHSIFTNIKLHKKVIKDYKLFMVVFILLTFDVCILIVWQYFDPFYRETNNGTSIQDSDNEDVIIVPEMEHCQSKRMTIFLSVIYVYKGLLMAFGCFLAWETRHVSIPALNDSKYIGLSVYNVVIMCVIGASLSFVLRDQQDASFVIISIFIIFCSTTTLCLVFVPKIIELKQNPRAGDHRVRATLKTFKKNYREEALGAAASCRDVHGNLIGRGYSVNLNERIKILMDENIKQRSTLKEKTYELEALTYKYRKIQNMIQSGQYQQALNTTGANINQATGYDKLTSNLSPKDRPSKMSITFQNLTDKDNLKSSIRSAEVPTEGFTTYSKSPQLSNVGHVITTNTTSTNNTSELVTDYSSCKMISNTTSSTNIGTTGVGKRALVAFDCPAGGKRSTSDIKGSVKTSRCGDTILSYAQNLAQISQYNRQQSTDQTKKTLRVGKHECRYARGSPRCTTDSSYCSMGLDYEISGARRSQDDLDLFTVFSYIANSSCGVNRREDKKGEKAAEKNFTRWSEGPFCTLMVRNNKSGIANSPGGAVPKSRVVLDVSSQCEQASDFGSSCPDLAAKLAAKSSVTSETRKNPPRQLSQQDDCPKLKKTIGPHFNKMNQLPRTLSMIEYLGMDEFDMIARRHDKLIRRKNLRRANPCCYHQLQACRLCAASMAVSADSRQDQLTKCPLTLTDKPATYSSNDPLNSTDLVQTNSHLSCSSCCSLATPSYESQSDVFDETSLSSSTGSSRTTSTSASGSLTHYVSHSQSTTSTNSNTDRFDKYPIRYCQHHAQAHSTSSSRHPATPYHQHHHHHELDEPASPSTTSTSSIYQDQLATVERTLSKPGLLQCGASSKDASANTPAEQIAGATGEKSTTRSGINDDDQVKASTELQQKLLIKCDVLENL